MRDTLTKLWAALTAIFTTVENAANALNHLSEYAEEAAEDVKLTARAERVARAKALLPVAKEAKAA